ncbi:MAG: hypothetical protein NTW78_10940 [Campylobacterales bacterium]|nr:hypothetical protein [Campylobacterales bacterium]
MNPRELQNSYLKNKQKFHDYIDTIKKNSPWDIYTIINPTLIKNPYTSDFPKKYFINGSEFSNRIMIFTKNIFKFYIKNFYLLLSYFIAFVLYKIYFKKQRKNEPKIIIDTFGLVDKTNTENIFNENYFAGIYKTFERFEIQYAILPRLYGVGKNPWKLVKFFSIINQDSRDFIFEYELLELKDFAFLSILTVLYPFKTLRLLQKERTIDDKIFNNSLLEDIKHFSFDSLTRYILGENLAKIQSIERIYSWSEFQVIERGFNFAVRKNSSAIKLVGCQFYLNYETYFNTYVDDLDYEMLSAPHEVFVNGTYYLLDRQKVEYNTGVSLRYKNIFDFKGIKEEKNILLLGSYIEKDTKHMLESVKEFDNVIFKNHPAVDIKKFGVLPKNVTVSNENIYKLFEHAKLVIGTASGTSVESLACGISVIIIASLDNLTANPLVAHGQGKIWDIAFEREDVNAIYANLMEFRVNHKNEIKEISAWYRDNFFVEPTEENIVEVFELKMKVS